MQRAVEQLQQLGFSQYEAQAYVTLLQKGPANGYELAKRSGIPRPNIYPVIQRLVERGVLLPVGTAEGACFAPVPHQELLERLQRQYTGAVEAAEHALNALDTALEPDYLANIRGYDPLMEAARRIIQATRGELLVVVWPEEALALAGVFLEAEERGIHVITLCLRGCTHTCASCRGEVFRYPLAADTQARWLVLVADGQTLLAGETREADTLGVVTHQGMMVSLTSGYIQNTIALAGLITDLGDRLDGLIDPHTQRGLNALQDQHHWLDELRHRIHS